MTILQTPEDKSAPQPPPFRTWKFWAGVFMTALLLGALGFWIWRVIQTGVTGDSSPSNSTAASIAHAAGKLPVIDAMRADILGIHRPIIFRTTIPNRSPDWVTQYTVQKGDSVDSIAKNYGLKPESMVWGNTELLSKDANFLQPGQALNILPTDGAFYEWKHDDTLENVAAYWNTSVDSILNWPGNGLNPLNPSINSGQWLILPGGWKHYDWEAAMIRTGNSTTYALGSGMCANGYDGPMGLGNWVWPTSNHWLSGNDWLGAAHPGIDIGIYLGMPIVAADDGVVVFAGWSQNRDGSQGYGNLVIIDHLNGWHTFYAHLLQINVTCGQVAHRGFTIGLGGSTGNSTGPHLHFEMRYQGAPQNPWGVLPPP
jgi:murein DD-endopeptidase MepM/ murein hydrolase activator NlpD